MYDQGRFFATIFESHVNNRQLLKNVRFPTERIIIKKLSETVREKLRDNLFKMYRSPLRTPQISTIALSFPTEDFHFETAAQLVIHYTFFNVLFHPGPVRHFIYCHQQGHGASIASERALKKRQCLLLPCFIDVDENRQ
jgi:hypothetical protein